MTTLTVANSSFSLSCPDVFSTPQAIQGYAADDTFDSGEVRPSETRMGVDGLLSGGFVPYSTTLTFVLMANSPSIEIMDQLLNAMDSAQETYILNATIVVPSLGKVYNFINGFLTGSKKMPQGRKLFESQRFEITFEQCTPNPI